jgi:hypothetical protein
VIDPEGDFVTLADTFGHVVIDAERIRGGELTRIAGRIRQHRVSVVLNLEGWMSRSRCAPRPPFLNGMFDADRDQWYPGAGRGRRGADVRPRCRRRSDRRSPPLSLGAMTNLMCRGRKRGLAGVIATQRLAKLAKNVAAEASNFLMGRTFLDIDMARAADLLGMERRQAEHVPRSAARPPSWRSARRMARRPLPIVIGTVETSARSTSPKLTPLPDAPGDARDLIFTSRPNEARRPMRQAPPPPVPTDDLLLQVSKPKLQPAPPAEPMFAVINEAERETGIGLVLREILDDPDAGFRSDAVLYQDFLVRCRIRRIAGEPLSLPAFRRRFAVARAGVDGRSEAGESWATALSLSEGLPDDLQGVFLVLAKAALDKAPCPSDAALARAYGSHSPPPCAPFAGIFRGTRLARRPHRPARPPSAGISGPWRGNRGRRRQCARCGGAASRGGIAISAGWQ